MGLGAPKVVHELDFRDISTVKPGTLGSYAETVDGRGYRLSLAGGTTLDPGKLCVAETVDSDATNKTVARTYAAGATEIIIDAGGAVTENRYVDGFLTINDADGEGISYLVKSNTGTSGAAELTVRLAEPIETALTIDVSEASLAANPWSGVVISVIDQADLPVGVPNVSITNAYYGWLQTRGVCAVWADAAFAAGAAVTTGTGTAGQVQAVALTEGTPNTGAAQPVIGVALAAGVDTEYREVYLKID